MATTAGISLLDVKVHLLLSYLSELLFTWILRADGIRLEGHPVVQSLIEHRVVLDRIRPLDAKLKYQVEKLLSSAMVAPGSAPRVKANKPNPNALVFDDEGEAGEAGEAGAEPAAGEPSKRDKKAGAAKESGTDGVYRPPRLVQMHYQEDEKSLKGLKKKQEKIRNLATKSTILQELRDEFGDGPLEINETAVRVGRSAQETAHERALREYEEETFQRKMLTKKDKKLMQQKRREAGQTQMDDYSNIEQFSKSIAMLSHDLKRKNRKAYEEKKLGGTGRKRSLAELAAELEGDGPVEHVGGMHTSTMRTDFGGSRGHSRGGSHAGPPKKKARFTKH
eukprot:TRINITY_DN12513_c0_g1_i1.p1 TRINITY_DN12513_c0_g1~~TRINITY_DN12513_c0_g1_i1.p1  ORF type:complete len:376 (-),score=97.96 TRINITY_DN12513_c0_g1_i1:859-1866(-)